MLTIRQQEVLVLGSLGLSEDGTARELGIGKHTVKKHWVEIRSRLGARSKHHAVALAFEKGILK